MLYASLVENAIDQYPLTIFQIRAMYPSVSWSDSPTDEALAPYNLVIVYPTDPPLLTKKNRNTTTVIEVTPVYISATGHWEQAWAIVSTSLVDTRKMSKARIAKERYQVETGGLDVVINGIHRRVATDRETQSKLIGLYLLAKENKLVSINWKFMDGVFVNLTTEQATMLSLAVSKHVGDCFDREHNLCKLIDKALTIEDCNIFF